MTNRVKRKLEAGESVVGSWVSIGHPAMAEIPAALSFDFVIVDTEHTSTSLETVENVLRAVDGTPGPTESVVRVAANDETQIKRVLDLGVAGVMVPMVESAAEAQAVVDAVRYPPAGNRGIAGSRASRYGLDLAANVDSAGEGLLTVVQVESEAGLANVDEIAAVEGVDVLFVGPADLSASLGIFGEWDHERYVDAIERVVSAAEEYDIAAGILAIDAEDVTEQLAMGFRFTVAGVDATHVVDGCRKAMSAYEEGLDEHE